MQISKFLLALLLSLSSITVWAGGKASLIAMDDKPLAPDFTLQDLDGNDVRLTDLKGQVVLVNYWATWCPPCRREMPSLQRLNQLMADKPFKILAVNVGEDEDTVFAFNGELEPMPEFTILLDLDSKVLRQWPVRGLPTTFILDKQGRMVFRAVGGREFDDPAIVDAIKELL